MLEMFTMWPSFLSTIPGAKVETKAMTELTLVLSMVSTSAMGFSWAGGVPRATPALFTKTWMSLNSSGRPSLSSPI